MYRTLIEKNGRGEEVTLRTCGTGNPRNPDGASFIIETNAGGKTMRLYLTYNEIKTLAQGLQTALHEADREYEDEQEEQEKESYADYRYEKLKDEALLEDSRNLSELTTDIMKGFF